MTAAIQSIVQDVAREFGVEARDIVGPYRYAELARARRLCYLLVRDLLHVGASEIGRAIGKRHESTVAAGWHAAQAELSRDDEFRRVYDTVRINHRERADLTLVSELRDINRTIRALQKRAALIAEKLGLTEEQAQAAE